MIITADGAAEPTINFTLEEEHGDVNINANGVLIAYFHVVSNGEVVLQLVSGMEEIKGLSLVNRRVEVKV